MCRRMSGARPDERKGKDPAKQRRRMVRGQDDPPDHTAGDGSSEKEAGDPSCEAQSPPHGRSSRQR